MANTKTAKKSPKNGSNKPKEIKEVKKEIKETKAEVKKENKLPKKKLIIIAASIVILIVLVILSITVFFNKERITTKKVKSMGVDYYTNYLYGALSKDMSKEDLNNVLEKYSLVGIKVNLELIEKYDSKKYKEVIKKLESKKYKCNKSTTRAVIYPQKPYGKTDYKVEVELDCGFNK